MRRYLSLPLISGLFLAAISLYFSATGLIHLFAGAGTGILLMAIAFELAKVTGLTWMIQNARPNLLTVSLSFALVCLVGISSLGIYGYLGRAYQQGHVQASISTSLATTSAASVRSLEADRDRLYRMVESVPLESPTAKRRLLLTLQPQIDRVEKDLVTKRDLAVTGLTAAVASDIGEYRFAADLLGTSQDGIAKLVITVLALLLDPLAVMLILASGVKKAHIVEVGVTETTAEKILSAPLHDEKASDAASVESHASYDSEHLGLAESEELFDVTSIPLDGLMLERPEESLRLVAESPALRKVVTAARSGKPVTVVANGRTSDRRQKQRRSNNLRGEKNDDAEAFVPARGGGALPDD